MAIRKVILKYSTEDVHLNLALKDYRDKINEMIDNIPWLTSTVEYIRLEDTNDTHYLQLFWGEDETVDNRTLEIDVNAANRVINLSGNLTLSGNNKVASWEATANMKTPELYYTGDLKIEPDAQGDVTFFEDTDVGDATDGKALVIHRKAAEFDKYMKFYIDQCGSFRIDVQQTGGTDIDNTFIGRDTGGAIEAGGTENVCIGSSAGSLLSTGDKNTFIGHEAGNKLTTEEACTFIGCEAGRDVTGHQNTSIGYQAMEEGTTGTGNTAIGYKSLNENHTGNNNVCIGWKAGMGYNNNNWSSCTYIGYSVGVGTKTGASDNTGIGSTAMQSVTTGIRNLALGSEALFYNQTGSYNTALGGKSMKGSSGQSASYNTAIGYYSGYGITTGQYNLFLGGYSGSDITTGSNNTFFGYRAGEDITTGTGNICIGYYAGSGQLTTDNNELWIANSNTATPLIYGEFDNAILRIYGSLCLPSNNELRFYDNGNYVGFEAPALGADFIWKLPAVDGAGNDVLATDAAGQLIWITGTSLGNVLAAANFGTDNVIIRSDGVGKGVQHTGIVIDNSNNISGIGTLGCGVATLAGGGVNATLGLNHYLVHPSYLTTYRHKVEISVSTTTASNKMDFYLCDGTTTGFTNILNLRSTGINVMPDTDNSAQIGRAHIGHIGFNDYAGFSHVDSDATSSYALLQSPIGSTFLNAASGQPISFRINNADMIVISSTGNLTFTSATSTITGGTVLTLDAGNQIESPPMYDITTVNGTNMVVRDIAGHHVVCRSTSGKKYKDGITDLEVDSSLIYNLRPTSFNSKCKDDDKKRRYIGLIADEVGEVFPEIVSYNEDNEVEGYDNQMLITLLLAEIQNLRIELNELNSQKPKG